MKFYVTFGPAHVDSEGYSLGGKYTVINARSEGEARAQMSLIRGQAYSSMYHDTEGAKITSSYTLAYVSSDELFLDDKAAPRGFDVVLVKKSEVGNV